MGSLSTVGGTTSTFASASGTTGSSDPVTLTADNSGYNVTTFPAATLRNKTAGIEFRTSTTGFQSLTVSWDQRFSNTAANRARLQYSTDGGTVYTDVASPFTASVGDRFFNNNQYDLSGMAELNNRVDVRFRIVSEFSTPVSNPTSYTAVNASSTYGTGGTWRFDMVTVRGAALPTPQPDLTVALSGPASATAGQPFTYTLAASNSGDAAATNVPLSFTLPTGVTYGSAGTTNNFTVSQSGNVVLFTGGELTPSNSATLTVTVSAQASGSITVQPGAAVVDPANTIAESNETNNSSAATITTTVGAANQPPAAPTLTDQTGIVAVPYSYTVPAFTDPESQVITYTIIGVPAGLSADNTTLVISGTPTVTEISMVTVVATDAAGASTTATFGLTINANQPPVAPAVSDQTATVGTAFSYAVPAFTDAENQTLVYGATGLPSGLTFDPATRTVSGTPTMAGTLSLAITATDPASNTASVSFTIMVSAPAPVLTATPTSLASFSTIAGTMSAAQTYTLSGSNLTANLTVSAPAGFQVSSDSSIFQDQLTLTPSSGAVAATISVRLTGTTQGTYTGDVTNSSGAVSAPVAVNGMVSVAPSPTLTATPTSLASFRTTVGTVSVAQNYTLSGSNLTADVTVSAPTGFQVSSNGTTFQSQLTLTPVSGVVAATISVRLAGTMQGTLTANVTNSSGAVSALVAVNGTVSSAPVVNGPVPVPLASQPNFTYTENFAAVANWANSFTAGTGANRFAPIAAGGTGTIPDPNRITASSAAFSSGTSGGVQKGTGNLVLLSTGATDNTTSTAVDFLVDFMGVKAGRLSFDAAQVSNSTGNRPGTLKVYGSPDGTTFTDLGADFTAINNVASTSAISVALPTTFDNVATARFRFYYYNGGPGGGSGSRPKISIDNLTITGTQLSTDPALAVAPPTLTGFSTTQGIPSASQMYTVTASNLVAPVTVTAPAGVDISLTAGTGYANSLSLPATTTSTVVYTRLTGAIVGLVSGNITHTSNTTLTASVSISGQVNDPNTPALAVTTTTLSGFAAVQGNASDTQTFSIVANNLSGQIINVVAPAGFELTTGSVYSTNLTVTPTNSASTIPVTIRTTASTPVGAISGNVIVSQGALSANVAVSGTISASVGVTRISSIQGSGSTFNTAFGGSQTIEGIVTRTFPGATRLNGFYVQAEDADSDGNPATSEGMFVYDPAGLFTGNVGDKVRVTGTVGEFTSSSGGNSSSLTQLTTLTSVLNLGANTLPAATLVQLPVTNISDLERYEGMLITATAATGNLTVTEYFQLGRFGQVVLAANGASNNPGTDARLDQYTQFNAPSVSGYSAYLAEIAKRRIILDDGSSVQNPDPIIFGRGGSPLSASNTLRGGDEVASVTAVLDERLEGYRLQTTTGVNFLATNARATTPPAVGGSLKVAGFNLLNYFNGNGQGGGFPTSRGADTQAEFTRQRNKTIQAIVQSGVDVFALNELENDGYGSTSAIQDLINGVNAVAGPASFTFINPGTSISTDEITVAMIYKPSKVTPVGAAATLTSSSAFISVGRLPLAQTFRENATGGVFTAVANHFKSKGSSSGGAGDADSGDGQSQSNGTRTRQAQDLAAWLATNPTGTTDPDYLVLGDLNAYAQENPLTALAAGGFTNLLPNTSYSYVFDGQVGSLDHALGSASLRSQVSGAEKWHINSDEPSVLDYNVEFKTSGQVSSLYNADQFRTSDHDPVIVGLSLTPLTSPLALTLTANPSTLLTTETMTLSAVVAGGTTPYSYTFMGPGTIVMTANTALVSAIPAGVQSFTVLVRDGTSPASQTALATVSVIVSAPNQAPVAPTVTSQTATVGQAFSYTVPAFTDPENQALTYTATINPVNGLVFDPATRVISGQPTTTGVSSVTITATDPGSLSASTTITITVNPVPNTAPTLANAIQPQSATVGQAYTLSLANVFTDAQTPNALTLTVTGLPAGLSFTAPATISGTPGTNTGSPISVTVTATDPGSLSATTTFSLSINAAPAGLIRITEYMYNGTPGEYVELTNVGNAPVDMTGWSYDDNTRTAGSFSLSGFGIVQPGESVVFTEANATVFRTAWYLPASVKVVGGSDQGLGRSDEINIYNAAGTLVDRLTYNDQGIAGSVRTADISGWTERANLGLNPAASYKLSTIGDVQNSYLATTGNLGNPGGYFTPLNRVLIVESATSTTVAEGGATDTYTVALNSRPSADVTVTINTGSQLTTSPAVLTFTPTSYSTAQTVTVAAVDDNLVEGVHTAQITHSTTSPDLAYNGIATNPVSVMITDNDNPVTAVPTIRVAASTTPYLSLSATGAGYASAVINDPTDPATTLGINFTLADTDTPVSSLTVTASSSNSAVASALTLTGTDAVRNLTITPAGVGYSTITVTVTDGVNNSSYVVNYAASASSSTSSTTRFHTGTSDASTAIRIDDNYTLVADDENQVIRLYNRQNSGLPVAGFDFTSSLALTDISGGVPREVDLEASTRLGNRIFWMGSESNADGGNDRPNRNRVFATDVAGAGVSTTLTYVGRYDYLRNDIIAWDVNNGHGKGANYYGLAASAAAGVGSKLTTGFNIEGVELAPNNTTAYVSFRAPQVPPTNRRNALIIPVTNFTALPVLGNGGTQGSATFGAPIELDLGGRGIREIRKNANNEYIIIGGAAGDAGAAPNDFRLYTWTGNAADAPVVRTTDLMALNANGSFESIVEVPSPLTDASPIQLLVDNGDAVLYNDGVIAKELTQNNFKKFRSEIVLLGGAVNTAPTVANIVAPQSATVGQAYTLSLAGVFTDAQTPNQLTLSVSGLPAGLSFVAPATISGTPSVSGVSTITVTATDPGSLSANTSFTLTVSPAPVVNTAPTVANVVVPQSATVGQGYTLSLANVFTDAQTPNQLTLSVVGLPTGLIFTAPGTISGTPSTTVGSPVSITVIATDPGSLSTSTSFALTISPAPVVNTAPAVVNPVAPQSATVGQAYTLSLAGVFTDAQTLSQLILSVSTLPQGLSLVGSTISGTPSVSGVTSVIVTATDPGNLSAITSFALTVSPAPVVNTAPTLANTIAPQSATVGQAYTLSLANVFTDAQTPNQLILSANGLPSGLSLSGTTISGTPSVSGVSNVIIIATDPGNLSNSTSFTLTVSPAPVINTAPTVANVVAPQSATVGQAYTLSLANVFTDAQTPNQLTLSVNGLLTGLSLSGTTISGTPSVSGVSTITVTATDPGSLSASTSFVLTVSPAAIPPTRPFALMGVTTVNCVSVSAGVRQVSFMPQYAGLSGQPVSFSVANELSPTMAAGPYTLQLYTDNPTITLVARQGDVVSQFTYNWLASCGGTTPPVNTAPMVANPIGAQNTTVGQAYTLSLAGVFTDAQTPNQLILSVSGLPAGLSFVAPATISGTPLISGVSNITVTATDPGNLSASTNFVLTVNSAGTTPPTDAFALTGVTTVNCVSVSAGVRQVSFVPQYTGLSGQPVSFSVVNELSPTMAAGPYTLQLYTDNPVITLVARQGNVVSQFTYNWLANCGSGNARVITESVERLSVLVLGNPTPAETVAVEIRGVAEQTVQIQLVNSQGQLVSQRTIEQAGTVERPTVQLGKTSGTYLLQVSTATQKQTVKIVKQ
jgi:predicted extracellular nuclease